LEKKRLCWVTLIYEIIPESVDIYVIPKSHLVKGDLATLKRTNNECLIAPKSFHPGPLDQIRTMSQVQSPCKDTLAKLRLLWYVREDPESLIDYSDLSSFFSGCEKGKWSSFRLGESQRIIPRSRVYRSTLYS